MMGALRFHMVSVPYTGTRFLRRILDDNGCPPVEQVHTYVEALWHHWFDGPVLCPIRDPMLHAIGMLNRNGPLGTQPRFAEFELLASLANDRTHFFRVDGDPETEITGLCAFLGVPLQVEWAHEGQSEDTTGWRARYLTTGELPDETWPEQIGDGTRALLQSLGYEMPWLEQPVGA